MKLKRREKILLSVAAGLSSSWGCGFSCSPETPEPMSSCSASRLRERPKSTTRRSNFRRRADAKRLAEWQRRALPPEPTLARSLYQDWLRSLADPRQPPRRPARLHRARAHRDQFTRITFSLNAQAKLGELVQFMYEFYSAGFLHQIRKLDIKPNKSSGDLNVDLSIEALSLPTAASKTQLSKEAGHGLQLAKLADYRDPIVKRDFFAPYRPKMPERARKAGSRSGRLCLRDRIHRS